MKKKQKKSGSREAAETFVTLLDGWLHANADRVRLAYDSGSGWEVWLHVELFLYIKEQLPTANIVREKGSYEGGLRPDFTFEGVTVEVKTEGEKQTGKAFGDGVYEDMGKVEDLGGSYALVIGVCCTDGARAELEDLTTAKLPAITRNGKTVHYAWSASGS